MRICRRVAPSGRFPQRAHRHGEAHREQADRRDGQGESPALQEAGDEFGGGVFVGRDPASLEPGEQVGVEGRRVGVAVGRNGGGGASRDRQQFAGHAGRRPRAPEHLAQRGAQAVHVGAGVDGLPRRLLGGRVAGGADTRLAAAPFLERAREPPVGHDGLAEGAHEHVVRLHVTVQHTVAVGVGQRGGGVEHVPHQPQTRREVRCRADRVGEGIAPEQSHRVPDPPVGPTPRRVDRHDPGVFQPRGHGGLPGEAGRPRLVARGDHLDRHVAPEARVIGGAHLAHSAPAQDAPELEREGVGVAERRRDGRRGRAAAAGGRSH